MFMFYVCLEDNIFFKKRNITFPYKYNVVKCQKFYSSKLTGEVTSKMLQLVKGESKGYGHTQSRMLKWIC